MGVRLYYLLDNYSKDGGILGSANLLILCDHSFILSHALQTGQNTFKHVLRIIFIDNSDLPQPLQLNPTLFILL